MEPKIQVPNLSEWEVAKAKQAEDCGKAVSLIEDLEKFGYWAGCFEQLAKAVEELKSSTICLEVTPVE